MNVIPLHRGPEARTVRCVLCGEVYSAPDPAATVDAWLSHVAACTVRRGEAVRALDGAS